jgi:hypothetical protein
MPNEEKPKNRTTRPILRFKNENRDHRSAENKNTKKIEKMFYFL